MSKPEGGLSFVPWMAITGGRISTSKARENRIEKEENNAIQKRIGTEENNAGEIG